uniref:Uncharacterized protein n=1 Tax=Cucumis melo TaxID=3656 RepID=A0A9I9D5J4_CUCME
MSSMARYIEMMKHLYEKKLRFHFLDRLRVIEVLRLCCFRGNQVSCSCSK